VAKKTRMDGIGDDDSDRIAQKSNANRNGELLEVLGFDLLAQIEAMLRHAREYQREVQRVRGILGKGQTATSDLPPLDAVRHHLQQMRQVCTSFRDTLTDAQSAADSFENTDGPRAPDA
jgi:hypothetical protein